MNPKARSILAAIEASKKTPASFGLQLRLWFSRIIHRELKVKGWSQAKLAAKAGVQEPLISRVMHAEQNCTFDTAGKLLWALGVRARILEPFVVEESTAEKAIEFTHSYLGAISHGQGIRQETTEDVLELQTS